MATAARSRPFHAAPAQLLSAATLSLATAALLLALLQVWEAGAVVGLVAVLVGGWAQLVSETRTERFENIFGITLAAVVLGVCLASGGALVD